MQNFYVLTKCVRKLIYQCVSLSFKDLDIIRNFKMLMFLLIFIVIMLNVNIILADL